MAQPKGTERQFRELNALEQRIARDEQVLESAGAAIEDARWHQAQIVHGLLDEGMTQRDVAKSWINADTGKPYSAKHVNHVAQAWRRFHKETPRPRWTDAMATVWARSDEVKTTTEVQREFHEARAPKSEDTAERLVQNLLKQKPEIVETVYHGLREGRENRYVEPKERDRRRKEAEAWARDKTEPIINAFSRLSVILELENALDELRDMSGLSADDHRTILDLLEQIRQEAEVKHAMAEVQ